VTSRAARSAFAPAMIAAYWGQPRLWAPLLVPGWLVALTLMGWTAALSWRRPGARRRLNVPCNVPVGWSPSAPAGGRFGLEQGAGTAGHLRYTRSMRTVVACLIAAAAGLMLSSGVGATPPEDVAAYCRAVYPQVQFQVRCLNVENAAADRVSRVAAGADRDSFNRCLAISPSWAAMENCLTQVARGAPVGGAGGVQGPLGPGQEPAGARTDQGSAPPAGAAGVPAGAAPPAPAPGVSDPGSSTTVLGPQPGAPSATAAEGQRVTRPIPEEDADRQLRRVLEREGTPAAHCTKKQYGPGWAIICE
jgi:hypothetical protein